MQSSPIPITTDRASLPLSERLCTLAIGMNNGLAAILGHCELMSDFAEPGSECAARLSKIQEIARALSAKINAHECRMVSEDPGGYVRLTKSADVQLERPTTSYCGI